MIVRVDKERAKALRRKLWADDVYVIFHDVLKQYQKEGKTELSPVEIFCNAKNLSEIILALPDMDEGLEDEIEDLEDECAADPNDAFLICMETAAILYQQEKTRIGFSSKNIIQQIYAKWIDHELFMPLLNLCVDKETERYLAGKRTDLFRHVVNELEDENDDDKPEDLFDYIIKNPSITNADGLKEILNILNKYNLDHNHKYDTQIKAIYDIMSEKTTSINNVAGDLVMKKEVQNEVNGVSPNGVGVKIYN